MADARRGPNGEIRGDGPYPNGPELELRIERCGPPAPGLVAHVVKDQTGRIRGMLALELDASEMDDPVRLMERVSRGIQIPKPTLRLVS